MDEDPANGLVRISAEAQIQRPEAVSFGPFVLHATKRLLECDGAPIQLGGRALEILIALTDRPGEVVGKRELIARVWPGLTVDESNLRFQMAVLRKALSAARSEERYIVTVPGRGYCFVAPTAQADAPAAPGGTAHRANTLSPRLGRMVGRDEAIGRITEGLTASRFVSIVGPGGIGKTTVAVSIAHRLFARFNGAVRFFDLSPLNNPGLVANAIASALGLIVQSDDPIAALVAFLRDKRMLLVFDSCEHVIEMTAALTERIHGEAPEIHILATSREPLRAEGEQVHRIEPLGHPPDHAVLTASETLAFPAVQLFVERVAASGHPFQLSEANAPIVREICRKLDGIALALELAASNVEVYGIEQTAALLGDRFEMLRQGRRTAAPRHQTLTAMFDWSHELLPQDERLVLRRLAIFVGTFTLDSCVAVVSGPDMDAARIVAAVASLVRKSLVTADAGDGGTLYRLLDTTRSYALGKLRESGEADDTARRHAAYYRGLIEQLDIEHRKGKRQNGYAVFGAHLGNVRSALEWAFDRGDSPRLAVELSLSAVRMFVSMSLLTECHIWAERALASLDSESRDTRLEMGLLSALGLAGMFTRGNSETVRTAFVRSLALSETLGEPVHQLRMLGLLHIFHERIGDYHSALTFAQRGEGVANEIADLAGISASHSLLGIAHHLIGDQSLARGHLDTALSLPSVSERIHDNHFGFFHENRARIALARTLWLLGFADQAQELARSTVEEAEGLNHPVSLCIALIWAVSVFLWSGDLDSAEDHIEQFIAHADKHSLRPYNAVGQGVRGQLLAKRGRFDAGIALMENALVTLHAARYELLTTAFNSSLAEALASKKDLERALALTEDTIARVELGGDMFYMPDLLRIKADILAAAFPSERAQAETCYIGAIQMARSQSSLSWELRAATGLALWRSAHDRGATAHEDLAAVYGRFSEGFQTADLKKAQNVLDRLRAGQGPAHLTTTNASL